MSWRAGVVALAVFFGLGCGSGGAPLGAGATPGGAQDIGYARKLVDEGRVPPPEAFVAEGLYSEHDLALEGEPCSAVLCLQGGLGVATAVDTEKREAFVQVGFSSGVDLSTFKRRPLNVSLLIDRSGSMTGDSLAAVKTAAHRLIDQLHEGDLLSVVLFDDRVDVLQTPRAVTDRAALKRVIDSIDARGSTCIECGMKKSYELLQSVESSARANRVLLFTDAMPNVGATGEGEFTTLMTDHAANGRELSVFGVGLDFGQALITKISATRGANYFYLADSERTAKVFDQDFDFLVTPLAYDFHLTLAPAVEQRLEAVYGLPGIEPGATQAELKVATLFLSRSKGAIVARLVGSVGPGTKVLSGEFSIRTAQGETQRSTLSAAYGEMQGGEGSWYSQPMVRKTVALTQLIIGAKEASRLWHDGEREAARTFIDRTATLLRSEADETQDAGLLAEAAFVEKLAGLMR